MHEKVYDFTLEGEIADGNLVQSKAELIKAIEDGMRDGGYVPLLDIDPQFTLTYKPEEEKYDFVLTVYGVENDNPWEISGVMYGKTIKSSMQTK